VGDRAYASEGALTWQDIQDGWKDAVATMREYIVKHKADMEASLTRTANSLTRCVLGHAYQLRDRLAECFSFACEPPLPSSESLLRGVPATPTSLIHFGFRSVVRQPQLTSLASLSRRPN